MSVMPNHRPRPEPYPDELDQLYCDECETLCTPPDEDGYDDRPCLCCSIAAAEDEYHSDEKLREITR